MCSVETRVRMTEVRNDSAEARALTCNQPVPQGERALLGLINQIKVVIKVLTGQQKQDEKVKAKREIRLSEQQVIQQL